MLSGAVSHILLGKSTIPPLCVRSRILQLTLTSRLYLHAPSEGPSSGAARSGLRALPYSLRLRCEGLEEKFLERGAPAPLSVRLKG